ncbi:MAG: hypothetical protein KC503_27860 [Myxococcales bacterium]|nr:hypothetical protein [Myxococcales bacterium]
MRVRRGQAFRQEVERYGLRFCCEDCAFFDDDSERCAHGWPTEEHRRARYEHGEPDDWVLYCKEFELR